MGKTVAPGFRAVVFALRDLLPGDKKYITDLAHALRWSPERESALWDTPLLLGRQSDTPPVPGLRTDAEVAASGPSVLLLAMRLLLADALLWPELRFLGLDLHKDRPDYVLYAADPERFTPESLADALTGGSAATGATAVTAASWHIQRGLQPRPERQPTVPGDRVPVLGVQVPLFGGRLANLRDLRPLAERRRAPLDLPAEARALHRDVHPGVHPGVPPGAMAGHHQDPYALFLLLELCGLADPDCEEAQVELTLFQLDTRTGSTARTALQLRLRDLSVLHDAEGGQLSPAALSDWLAELLPSCFLAAPNGAVLIIDWFRLDLELGPALAPELASDPARAEPALRLCGAPDLHPAVKELDGEAVDPALLEPAVWSLPGLADLIAAADLTLSASGRYLLMESAAPLDGELLHLSVLLDLEAAPGPRLVRCDLLDEEAVLPAVAVGDVFPVLRGEHAAPGALAQR